MAGVWRPDPGMPPSGGWRISRRAGLVEKAASDWKNALVDLGGRNNLLHYRDLKLGTLDLTAADPEVVSGLLQGKTIRVTALFSDPEEAEQVLRRIRAMHNKAKENLEERGLETLSIACGLATWENKRAAWEPCAPVLLQHASLRPSARRRTSSSSRLPVRWRSTRRCCTCSRLTSTARSTRRRWRRDPTA